MKIPKQIFVLLIFFALVFYLRVNREKNEEHLRSIAKNLVNRALDVTYTSNFDSKMEDYCDGVEFKDGNQATNAIMDIIINARSDKPLEQLANSDTEILDYGMSLLPAVIPFLFLFLCSIIGWCVYCCCNCECCCCKVKQKKKFTKCQKRWPVFTFLAGGAFVVACSIAGIVYSATLPSSYKMTKCGVSLFFNELLEGLHPDFTSNEDFTWAGIRGMIQHVKGVSNDFDTAALRYSTFTYDSSITSINNELISEIDTIDSFDIATAIDPDDINAQVDVVFIEDVIAGGVGKSSLEEERQTVVQIIIDALEDFEATVQDFSSTVGDKKTTISDSLELMEDFEGILGDNLNSVYDALDLLDMGIGFASTGFLVYYCLMISALGLSLVGTILLVFCKCRCFKCFNHLGWCILSLFLIIGFLFLTIMMPLSIILVESCDFLDGFFEEDNLLNKQSFLDDDSSNYINTCFNGDGDLTKDFNLKEVFQFAYDQLDQEATVEQNIAKLQGDDFYVTNQMIETIETFQDGSNIGGACVGGVAATTLSTIQSSSDEEFVFDKTTCTDPLDICDSGHTTGCCANLGEAEFDTQVEVNDFSTHSEYSLIQTLVAHLNSLNNRLFRSDQGFVAGTYYVAIGSPALNTYDGVPGETTYSILYGLKLHKITLISIKSPVQNTVDDMKAINDDTRDTLDKITEDIPEGLNCKFLKPTYQRMHTSFCGNVIPSITSMTILIALISLMNIFNICFTTCMNRRIGRKKTTPQNEGTKKPRS